MILPLLYTTTVSCKSLLLLCCVETLCIVSPHASICSSHCKIADWTLFTGRSWMYYNRIMQIYTLSIRCTQIEFEMEVMHSLSRFYTYTVILFNINFKFSVKSILLDIIFIFEKWGEVGDFHLTYNWHSSRLSGLVEAWNLCSIADFAWTISTSRWFLSSYRLI